MTIHSGDAPNDPGPAPKREESGEASPGDRGHGESLPVEEDPPIDLDTAHERAS